MQKTDITSFPVPDRVKDDWQFAEVWIEPMLSPPYILLLLGGSGLDVLLNSIEGQPSSTSGTSSNISETPPC